jgi:hypothetical protein
MSDLSQESLLREIDEDIRREKYAKLWKRYGNLVIGAAVLLVVAVAGYQLWQQHVQDERDAAGARFTQALALARTDRAAAEQAMRDIAEDAPDGYAMLATLQQAALLAQNGDRQGARSIYQELQKSADDRTYSQLAVLLDALTALEGEALPIDADAVRSKLEPLTVVGNPWRFTARELIAVLAWRSGQMAEARTQLSALAADPQTPVDIRGRAQQMLTQIGET